jgi:ethanolamine utilization protein EutQ
MERVLFSAVVDGTVSNTLGASLARFAKGSRVEWKLVYDEIIYVIEGVLTIRAGDKEIVGSPGAMVWLPKDTDVIYEGDDALIAYAICPADWGDAYPAEAARLRA